LDPDPVALSGVPETTLWTLHNRASEARRRDTFLPDPDCVRVYESIAYDFVRRFGRPDGSHPMRSRIFDDVVRPWMASHPGGSVVELGAGLETQFHRCDDGRVQWLCVDVPEGIEVRGRFLPASARCLHVGRSALDLAWMEDVDPARGVFVTAQGLFMYFDPSLVERLLQAIVHRFQGVELMFDTIPRWFSRKTLTGFAKTRHYTAPPMPWGSIGTRSRASSTAGATVFARCVWYSMDTRVARDGSCSKCSREFHGCATSCRRSSTSGRPLQRGRSSADA
jgi:O-methyltransferase involved in polyketide biosynthesis